MNPHNPFEGLEDITPNSPASGPATPTAAPMNAQPAQVGLGQSANTQAWKPASNSPEPRSRKPLWFSIVGVVIAGVLGGGYYAYSQGYVDVPFLPTVPSRMMTKLVLSANDLKQAQYSFRVDASTEPRDASQKAISMSAADEPSSNLFDQYGLMLGNTTADINGSASLTFYYDYAQPVASSNAFLTITASDTDKPENDLALEIRKVGLDLYGQVTKLPKGLTEFLDVNSFMGTWIHLSDNESSMFSEQEVKDFSLEEQIDEMKRLTRIAARSKVIRDLKRVGDESVGDASAERYSFGIDSTKLEPFLQSLIDDYKDRNKPTAELERALTELRSDKSAQLKEFFDATTFDIWVEKSSGLVRQFSTTVLVDRGSGKQLRTSIKMSLEKLNQIVPVERPTGAKKIEDIMASMMGVPSVETPNADGSPFLASIEKDRVGSCYLSKNPAALSFYADELKDSYRGYAETTQPASLCEGLTDGQIAEAGNKLAIDSDADRLNLLLEEVYGSSDAKADTDNDSFSDLQEIENGYNPNGPGTLIDAL